MKAFILVASLFLLIGCSPKSATTVQPQTESQNNTTQPPVKAIEEKPLEKLKPPSKQIKVPDVKDFGVFNLKRNSKNKDEDGLDIPPFDDAEVLIGLYLEPQIGEKVTIIPLKVNFEPFQLSITKVGEKKEVPCSTEKKKFYWDLELEKITDKAILEIKPVENDNQEMPFEVFGIYPAVEFARNIPQSELSLDMLPKGVAIQTIDGAVDLDNDGKPDLLEIAFCCEKPSESWSENNDCDICQKSFKKSNGVWKLIDSAAPC